MGFWNTLLVQDCRCIEGKRLFYVTMHSPTGRGNCISYTLWLAPGACCCSLLRGKLCLSLSSVDRQGEQHFWEEAEVRTKEGWHGRGWSLGAANLCSSSWTILSLWEPARAWPLLILPLFLVLKQLGARRRDRSGKQDSVLALKSQEVPDNRKCW